MQNFLKYMSIGLNEKFSTTIKKVTFLIENVLVLNGDGVEEEQEREFQGDWSNEVGGGLEPTPIEDQVIPFHYSPPLSNHQPTKPHTPYM